MAEEKESPEQSTKPRTSKLAIVAAVMGWIFILFLVWWMLYHSTCRPPIRVICGTNLKGLGTAMIVYANYHNDMLPPADQWCDLLITEVDVSPKSLVCPDSDAVEGESSYAMNINVAGKKNTFPADVVLLFETDAGWDGDSRSMPIANRRFYSSFKESNVKYYRDKQVYPRRWNMAGGPEMLTTRYHKGEGCNITFVDGHTSYIPSSQIQKLHWTAE